MSRPERTHQTPPKVIPYPPAWTIFRMSPSAQKRPRIRAPRDFAPPPFPEKTTATINNWGRGRVCGIGQPYVPESWPAAPVPGFERLPRSRPLFSAHQKKETKTNAFSSNRAPDTKPSKPVSSPITPKLGQGKLQPACPWPQNRRNSSKRELGKNRVEESPLPVTPCTTTRVVERGVSNDGRQQAQTPAEGTVLGRQKGR